MECGCEKLVDEEVSGDITKKLTCLGSSGYQDGGVCGSFEVKYWYNCRDCNNIYIEQVYDGDSFGLKKAYDKVSRKRLQEIKDSLDKK
jgi:hypothetical protein